MVQPVAPIRERAAGAGAGALLDYFEKRARAAGPQDVQRHRLIVALCPQQLRREKAAAAQTNVRP